MARGVEKSLWTVILEARGTHKPEKNMFRGGCFFESIFGLEKGGVNPRNEHMEMACGPLKEDNGRYLRVFSEVREEVRREEELERK